MDRSARCFGLRLVLLLPYLLGLLGQDNSSSIGNEQEACQRTSVGTCMPCITLVRQRDAEHIGAMPRKP
jgi:hypothetical protein